VKLLLDTHTLLWHAENDPRLGATALQLLSNSSNQFFLSMATVWEIAIKSGLKKLCLSKPFQEFITNSMINYPLTLLPISFDDCTFYETLGFPLPNHRDPFDRMLITHAFRQSLTIIGNDAKFDAYGISRLW
jgi:PIN domain nuclease of toxin-antitoxin system